MPSNPYTAGQIVDPNLTVSGIGRGSNINGANGNDRYNGSNWTNNSGSLSTSRYFNWILTPVAGYHINLNNFVYTGQISTGTGNFNFRSNANSDNFNTNIGAPVTAGTTITLTGSSFQNLTTATEFRLYGFSIASTGTTYSVNDFSFTGSILGTSVTTLSGFSACLNTAGTAQSFTINGTGLIPAGATITVAGTTSYEVSITDAISRVCQFSYFYSQPVEQYQHKPYG